MYNDRRRDGTAFRLHNPLAGLARIRARLDRVCWSPGLEVETSVQAGFDDVGHYFPRVECRRIPSIDRDGVLDARTLLWA